MEEDWVVLCQALYQSIGKGEWSDMHESFQEVCRNIGVNKAGQRIAGLGKLAWRDVRQGTLLFAEKDLQAAFNKRSELREYLLEAWTVDIHQSLCICEAWQVQVEASEASYVSFDRVA